MSATARNGDAWTGEVQDGHFIYQDAEGSLYESKEAPAYRIVMDNATVATDERSRRRIVLNTTISPQAGHKSAAKRLLTEAYDHIQSGDKLRAVETLREAARRLRLAGDIPEPCRTLLEHFKTGTTHTFFVMDALNSLNQ